MCNIGLSSLCCRDAEQRVQGCFWTYEKCRSFRRCATMVTGCCVSTRPTRLLILSTAKPKHTKASCYVRVCASNMSSCLRRGVGAWVENKYGLYLRRGRGATRETSLLSIEPQCYYRLQQQRCKHCSLGIRSGSLCNTGLSSLCSHERGAESAW